MAARIVSVLYDAGLADSKLNLTKLGPGTARNWNTVQKLATMIAS